MGLLTLLSFEGRDEVEEKLSIIPIVIGFLGLAGLLITPVVWLWVSSELSIYSRIMWTSFEFLVVGVAWSKIEDEVNS